MLEQSLAHPLHAGTRIRDRRTLQGLRQADLAKACDISPSYLNLIEHNRRRIGGALLVRIAAALGAEPSEISEGAEAALTATLEAAADTQSTLKAERDRLDELASRFPGWTRLIEAQHHEIRRLEQVVERLDDRLTHDPFLSASMHDVLTNVTAIRSASAILAGGETVEPEWQARFNRNIHEDSQRLAAATETLVRYLNDDENLGRKGVLPQEELEQWLAGQEWRIDALESDPDMSLESLLADAAGLDSPAVQGLARQYLGRYAQDVRAVPWRILGAALQDTHDPISLAARVGASLPLLFRRLAAAPKTDLPDGMPFGLIGCDASGAHTFQKSLPEFDAPRTGGACPLWPLYRALSQPMRPLSETLSISTREAHLFDVIAFAEISHPMGYDAPGITQSWMLIRAVPRGVERARVQPLGRTCRVCAEADCAARREASVFE